MNFLMTKVFFSVTLLTAFSCQSQQIVNDSIHQFRVMKGAEPYISKIPTNIYLDTLWEITNIYSNFDINEDGINDFAFKARHVDYKNGSPTRLEVHEINKKGESIHVLIYDNVFPLFFHRYDLEYIVSLSLEEQRYYPYSGEYPLDHLTFKNNRLEISIDISHGEGNEFVYSYNTKSKVWELFELTYWTEDFLGKRTYEQVNFQYQTLKQFNISDYL